MDRSWTGRKEWEELEAWAAAKGWDLPPFKTARLNPAELRGTTGPWSFVVALRWQERVNINFGANARTHATIPYLAVGSRLDLDVRLHGDHPAEIRGDDAAALSSETLIAITRFHSPRVHTDEGLLRRRPVLGIDAAGRLDDPAQLGRLIDTTVALAEDLRRAGRITPDPGNPIS